MQYYINTIFALKSLNLFLPGLFIFAKTPALLKSVETRRVTEDVTPGRLWGAWGVRRLADFMKDAVLIRSIL